jgi:hypothetical protein
MYRLTYYLLSRVLFFILLISFTKETLAWNAIGHRLIAQIAFDHLQPDVRNRVRELNEAIGETWGRRSLMTIADWADSLPHFGIKAFSPWHYINQSYSPQGVETKPYDTQNVVWAIHQSLHVLRSPKANIFEKGFFLRFLLHFTGDIHQPLHCINFFSKTFPHGDEGGTLYLIDATQDLSLHRLWDQGLGYFDAQIQDSRSFTDSFSNKRYPIKEIAKQLEAQYPPDSFQKEREITEPMQWAKESFEIATSFAYTAKPNTPLTKAYLTEGKTIVAKRIALAGYRLADLLNRNL